MKVPEGMLKAVNTRAKTCKCLHCEQNREAVLEVALCWLSEDPIMPSDEQCVEAWNRYDLRASLGKHDFRDWAAEWQRRMFLAPDLDEPIRDLLDKSYDHDYDCRDEVREAYRRGWEGK